MYKFRGTFDTVLELQFIFGDNTEERMISNPSFSDNFGSCQKKHLPSRGKMICQTARNKKHLAFVINKIAPTQILCIPISSFAEIWFLPTFVHGFKVAR